MWLKLQTLAEPKEKKKSVPTSTKKGFIGGNNSKQVLPTQCATKCRKLVMRLNNSKVGTFGRVVFSNFP